jgi:hypothetical protein
MNLNEQKAYIINNFGSASIQDIARRTGSTYNFVYRTALEYYVNRRDEWRSNQNAQNGGVHGQIQQQQLVVDAQNGKAARAVKPQPKKYYPNHYMIHLWAGCERSFVIKCSDDHEPDELYPVMDEPIDMRIARISMWEIEQMELGVYSMMNSVDVKRDLKNLCKKIINEIR